MDQHSWLTERFEQDRPRLRGVAYRMLGSLSEAEDAVQEAWLRLNRIDTATVDNLGGWLTTVVSHVCLDMLRSRKSRREESIDARATEPRIHGSRSLAIRLAFAISISRCSSSRNQGAANKRRSI